jgi:hypothetical protein
MKINPRFGGDDVRAIGFAYGLPLNRCRASKKLRQLEN